MSNKLRVALIGCGAISDNHIKAILDSGKADLVAICDVNLTRANAKKEKHGLNAKVYSDYRQMLNDEQLDAVHIATPHYLHCEMALEALKRNINVFLEKPMCIKEEDIEKLIEAERASNARVCVCFQNRFNSTTLYARRIANEDGGVLNAFATLFWKRDSAYYAQDEWRGKSELEGGGVMINQAIHTIDLLCYFLGKPQKIIASKSNHTLQGVIEVEDSCEGFIDFENGKRGNFYATNSAEIGDFTTVILMTKNHRIELRHPYLFIDNTLIEDAQNLIPSVGKACYGEGHNYIISAFYTALLDGTDVPVSLSDAEAATRVVLASYRSNDNDIFI